MKKIILCSILVLGMLFAKEANIAAAANLQYVLQEISKEFLLTHKNDKLNISYSSSGKAYAQISQSAPVDLFVSADEEFPQKLYMEKKTLDKPQIYAQGVLVLWSANPKIKIHTLEDLDQKDIFHIAIPNPELAPYGRAAKEVLQKTKLYDLVKSKLINASSISQAHQFVSSGNAEVGFGALSLIDKKDKKISYIIVDKSFYAPINQALVLTNYGKNNSLAKEFKEFILSTKAKKIFQKYGYIVNE
ncbi:molybdate ABC transporter substrate-binding protein [Helicobacter cappadocius]|uniref:Molybdate ABC transporter substrate-binding protein n=1 Tax=Helicobacter cappadocius TaxID=3063998 RepID=A0AA90Q2N2_9HELI|nr:MULTISPECIES: molybdate ABC transporter substrate-binding protein [unclassified Helicobacter]MDO7253018.1 molybdate ABC transporter substrate-binding protein [Helicobacter sp. faydin-H75]MDP2538993.1 molybdate ABC transporter substrate-binding protein [Helicobacter sp. faydin-H76]